MNYLRLGTKQTISKPAPVSSSGRYLWHTLALFTYATSKAPVLMLTYAKITTFVGHGQLSSSSLSQFMTHFACFLSENHLRTQQQLTHEIGSWLNPVTASDWYHIAQWTPKLLWNLSRGKGVFLLSVSSCFSANLLVVSCLYSHVSIIFNKLYKILTNTFGN